MNVYIFCTVKERWKIIYRLTNMYIWIIRR
jgi:hypothetical protein